MFVTRIASATPGRFSNVSDQRTFVTGNSIAVRFSPGRVASKSELSYYLHYAFDICWRRVGPHYNKHINLSLNQNLNFSFLRKHLQPAAKRLDELAYLCHRIALFNGLCDLGNDRRTNNGRVAYCHTSSICLRVEMPNPTAIGRSVNLHTWPTSISAALSVSLLAPLTPARETA